MSDRKFVLEKVAIDETCKYVKFVNEEREFIHLGAERWFSLGAPRAISLTVKAAS